MAKGKKRSKQQELRVATRRELKRQALASVGLIAIFGMLVAKFSFLLWLGMVVFTALLSWLVVFRVRRAIWFQIWRMVYIFPSFAMMTLTCLYIGCVSYVDGPLVAGCAPTTSAVYLAVSVIGGGLYFRFWIQPHWRDTTEWRMRYKINLEQGLFSVVNHWGRRGVESAGTARLMGLAIPAGFAFSLLVTKSGYYGFVLFLGLLGSFFTVIVTLFDGFYLYQLLQMERKIGRKIIIDAYADEAGR